MFKKRIRGRDLRSIVCFFIIILCLAFSVGRVSLAEQTFEKEFKKQFQKYQSHAKAGRAAINRKEYSIAAEHYTRAIEFSPFVASHYYYRGLAWYKKGDNDNAIEDFSKVIILDGRRASAFSYRGLCRMKGCRYLEALRDYRSALKLRPKDASVHNNLAWLYATAKDEKFRDKIKALEHAKKAAELSMERNAEILDTLARAYHINGKFEEAVETERKAIRLEPDNEKFKENLKVYEKGFVN